MISRVFLKENVALLFVKLIQIKKIFSLLLYFRTKKLGLFCNTNLMGKDYFYISEGETTCLEYFERKKLLLI